MSNNRHKNRCKRGERHTMKLRDVEVYEAWWFTKRRIRNRVRDRLAKIARRKNRGRR